MPLPIIVRAVTPAETRLASRELWSADAFDTWDPDPLVTLDQQIIRASFLRALLSGQVIPADKTDPLTDIQSIHLVHALIVGDLELSQSKIPHLFLEDSVVAGDLDFTSAEVSSIHLRRCFVLRGGIQAEALHCAGAVTLTDVQFPSRAVLQFAQASIGNNCTFSSLSAAPLTPKVDQLLLALAADVQALEAHVASQDAGSPAPLALSPEGLRANQDFAGVAQPGVLMATLWSASTGGSASDHLSRLSVKAARIGGDLTIEGLLISTCDHRCQRDGYCNQQHPSQEELAIDAERVEVKGDVSLQSTDVRRSVLRGGVKLAFAQITGHLSITGVWIRRCACGNALDCEGALIGGHFGIDPLRRTRTRLHGGLRILGAHIKGQLILRSIVIRGANAITGDGVIIDNDLFIRPATEDTKDVSVLCGRVRLPGALIGGQLNLHATRVLVAPTHPPAKTPPPAPSPSREATFSMRDITIKGGLFLVASRSRITSIVGGISLNDAVIGGVFEVIGTHITAAPNGAAINAIGANIKSDLLIAGVHPERHSDTVCEQCVIQGSVRIMGATIGGRLRLIGASLDSQQQESALMASGATIKGGIFVQSGHSPRNASTIPMHVHGALRMNQIQVGSRFHIRGSIIEAKAHNQRVAIAANGAHFASDVVFGPDEAEQATPGQTSAFRIIGEVRLVGAEIKGGFKSSSGEIFASADGTGFAIDGYNADISKGVQLGPGSSGGSLVIHGIVGFGYAHLGSFVMGNSGSIPGQQPPAGVQLRGHVRLSGAEIVDLTSLEYVLITPPSDASPHEAALKATIERTLNRWDTTRPATILSAQNADLGTMLSVRLDPASYGFVELLGAKVYTLDDHSTTALGWGEPPMCTAPLASITSGVCLGLVGFTYTHLMGNPHPPHVPIAASDSQYLALRTHWLRQQFVNNEPTPVTFSPLPYIQLASVFRAQGFNREADEISMQRRHLLVDHGTLRRFDKRLQWLYGTFFGFGYLSKQALATCLILLLVNIFFALIGAGDIHIPWPGHKQPWLVDAPHPNPHPSLFEFNFSFAPSQVKAAIRDPIASTVAPQSSASASPPITHGCPCVTRKRRHHRSQPPPPPQPPPLTQQGRAIGELQAPQPLSNRACSEPVIYAVDQTLPVIHVSSGNGCSVIRDAPIIYRGWRLLMLLLSWIIIPTAALTFSGILRETNR